MKKYVVKIVVPLYRCDLTDVECKVLVNNLDVLRDHKIVFLAPYNLDVDKLNVDISQYEIIRVSDEWLGNKRGIEGYNNMMLSKEIGRAHV